MAVLVDPTSALLSGRRRLRWVVPSNCPVVLGDQGIKPAI